MTALIFPRDFGSHLVMSSGEAALRGTSAKKQSVIAVESSTQDVMLSRCAEVDSGVEAAAIRP